MHFNRILMHFNQILIHFNFLSLIIMPWDFWDIVCTPIDPYLSRSLPRLSLLIHPGEYVFLSFFYSSVLTGA